MDWFITFPPTLRGDPTSLFEWVETVCELGERESVYRVLETPRPHAFQASSDRPWPGHVRRVYEQHGELLLFISGGPQPTEYGRLSTCTRVAHFDPNGSVVEVATTDLGALLRKLRPELSAQPMFMLPATCPVVLGGPHERGHSSPIVVTISIHSDIWFPFVLGLHDDGEEADRLSFSNAPLAQRHTLRLNRFLRDTKSAALQLGATWKLGELSILGTRYADFVMDDGIKVTSI